MIEIKPEAKKTDGITNDLVEITRPSIEKRIYVIRDKQVMLDSDLAVLYQVETGALNRAVKRNISQVQICVYIHLPAMLVRLCCLYLQEI